ncbi:MAG: FecR domain-containing protein [Kiloniellales bacterium]
MQLAQATGEPIGTVTELEGAARVNRAGGSQQLALGDPVYLNDELITPPGSSLTVTFVDGTLFSLAGDGRLVLDRMIYDPAGSDNELLVSLLQGSFSFITGEVSKVGGPGMQLTTPVGTIGVRGTAVVGDYDLVRLLVTLLQGQILFSNAVAQALMATAYDTLNVGSADQADLTVHSMTEAEQSVYGLLLPKILELVTPEAGEQDQDGGNGGTRVLPQSPEPEDDGAGDEDAGGPRGEVPSFTLEELQALVDQIVEELLQENPNLIFLAAAAGDDGGDGSVVPPPVDGPVDGSFETGFTGWETVGAATIETAAFNSGPTEGLNQALITTGTGAQSAASIEDLLGLALGSLTGLGNGTATEGSVITASFTLAAGDALSFDFNFLTDEIPAAGEVNDFAFVLIDDVLTELADTTTALVASDTRFVDETGFLSSFSFTAPEDGTYQLAIGVMDVDDTIVDSGLLIDNVTVTPAAPAVVEA